MPSIDLFRTGFTGVDLKTNPLLLLDKGRVRFAVNMVFEEGTLKSRPGFRFIKVSEPGQFQGGCLFRPSRGLSFQPFSTLPDLFAVVVSGSLVVGCREVAKTEHACRGDVHLAQAENYLLVSNPCGQTYWFDGSVLTPSPGLNEEHFEEVETPTHEMEDETVSAETPCQNSVSECDGEASVTLRFIDHATDESVGGVSFEIFLGDVRGEADEDISGVAIEADIGSDGGDYFLKLEEGIYTIRASVDGYVVYEDLFAVPAECQSYTVDVRVVPFPPLGILMATATSPGDNQAGDCGTGDVLKTFHNEPPYELAAGTYQLVFEFTTFDERWHKNCYYELQLGFDPDTVTVDWDLSQTGTEGNPWTVSNGGKTLRFSIEDSLECGGTNGNVQTGVAIATFTVSSTTQMDFDFVGIAETQDTGYENASFYLRSV